MKTVRVLDEEPPRPVAVSIPASVPFSVTTLPPNTIAHLAAARRNTSSFSVSMRSADFLRRHYPDATAHDWNDWRWQNRNRVRTLADLQRMIVLSDEENEAIKRHTGALPVGITPYYASLLDPDDTRQALRKTVVPVLGEYVVSRGENEDPLAEDSHSPVPGLVHRYPDTGQQLSLANGVQS